MIEPRWEVKIGSIVLATDGIYGHLQQLLVDPYQEKVIAFLVQSARLLSPHIAVVPEDLVAEASEDEVKLKIGIDQVEKLPKYQPHTSLTVEGKNYDTNDKLFAVQEGQRIKVGRAPSSRESGMIEDLNSNSESGFYGLRLRAGQNVFCNDGFAGRVSRVLLYPGGKVPGFVLHEGHLHLIGRETIVPVAWVQEVDQEYVHLSITRNDLESLPAYCPDDELGSLVDYSLWSDAILRNTDYGNIGISVKDGMVELRGHVVTRIHKEKAKAIVSLVPGVLDVKNSLVADDDLVNDVAHAFGKNEYTRSERILVGAQHGFVTLNGHVGNSIIRNAAEAAAAGVPQVRGVINYLQAPDVVNGTEEQKVWQPGIGQKVYASDLQLGPVERVVINPINRCVTAFVIAGPFPDPLNQESYSLSYEEPRRESSVLIPVSAVKYISNSSVLLGITRAEAALCDAFNPADFKAPAAEWQPPYPYLPGQVLFENMKK